MPEFMSYVFWENTVLSYCIAFVVFLASVVLITLFNRILLSRIRKWAEKTSTSIDDFLVGIFHKLLVPLSYFGAFYLSVNTLVLDAVVKKLINILGVAVLTLLTARLATLVIGYVFRIYSKRVKGGEALERSLQGIMRVTSFLIWALAVVFFLDNIGFKISTVIAGLGIGGIAVAMAAQALLKDFFSYFCILFDRPFEIGDFIIVGDYLGVVEYIGIKTTRIRSLSGEQLIFSNTDLTDSRVRNYKRMDKRRVVFKLGVTYDTSLEKLKEIPVIIKDIITNISDTAFDRAHFLSYGDFSLIFEIVYYVMGADYNKYMDIQQDINFKINEAFKKRGIEFAYPTQTIYVNKPKG